jgi:sugar/nucleoside kinase (ribokinase family)
MSVLVIGNTVADIFSEAEHLPRGTGPEFGAGTLVVANQAARLRVGGNAGRTAWLLGRLGLRVRLHTHLGADVWGAWLLGELAGCDVEVRGPVGGQSSTNFVGTDATGNRMSFFFPGSRDFGMPETNGTTSFVVIAACPFPDLEQVTAWLAALGRLAVPALVDIGPPLFGRPGLSELGALAGPHVYLTMNEAELSDITGSHDRAEGLRRVQAVGFGRVVVKLGADGALVSAGPGGPGRRVLAPALASDLHGTVGAGDSFNAGLVYGLSAGFDLTKAAALGNCVAWRALSGPEFGHDEGPRLAAQVDKDPQQIQEV